MCEKDITHNSNSVFNISDDIITHATNQKVHLQKLQNVCNKIWEKGLKLNLKNVNLAKLLLIT